MADDAARIAQLEAELQRRDAELRDARAENAALRADGEQRDRALSEALEQQTATAEVLRVIASSPTDLQRVLQAIVESATRLCEADNTAFFRVEGDEFVRMANLRPGPVRLQLACGFLSFAARGSVGPYWTSARSATTTLRRLSIGSIQSQLGRIASASRRRETRRTASVVCLWSRCYARATLSAPWL